MREKRSNKMWLLIGLFAIILFISVGYSFFSESLTIGATGIIGEPPKINLSELLLSNEEIVTSGDGLYYNDIDNRYHYFGVNVNNYITFNNETWRIVSFNKTGVVKIIKDSIISSKEVNDIENNNPYWSKYVSEDQMNNIKTTGNLPFDVKGKRPGNDAEITYYCEANNEGCNIFGITNIDNKIVNDDSSLKEYLNNNYYHSLSSDSNLLMLDTNYYMGPLDLNNSSIKDIYLSEQNYYILDKIGLLNISDYIFASANNSCQYGYNNDNCASLNWLNNGTSWFLINGQKSNTSTIYYINANGFISTQNADELNGLRPVLELTVNNYATGNGTKDDPYIIGVS